MNLSDDPIQTELRRYHDDAIAAVREWRELKEAMCSALPDELPILKDARADAARRMILAICHKTAAERNAMGVLRDSEEADIVGQVKLLADNGIVRNRDYHLSFIVDDRLRVKVDAPDASTAQRMTDLIHQYAEEIRREYERTKDVRILPCLYICPCRLNSLAERQGSSPIAVPSPAPNIATHAKGTHD